MKLFAQLEERGLVQTGFYGFTAGAETPKFVRCCNCCGVLRAIKINEFASSE